MIEPQEIPQDSRVSTRITAVLALVRRTVTEFWDSSIFTKLATIIGLVGGIIAATLGGHQLIQKILDLRETHEKVKEYVFAGDQFKGHFEFDKAIEEYKRAEALDKQNIDISRRMITTIRQALQKRAQVAHEADLPSYINDALEGLYQTQARHPSLKNDVQFLIEEARIQATDSRFQRFDAAYKILMRAHKLFPNDPDVLAELAFFIGYKQAQCMNCHLTVTTAVRTESIDNLRRAIESKPDTALYHYYLAKLLDSAAQRGEAMREYHQAAELATDQDYDPDGALLHKSGISDMVNFFRSGNDYDWFSNKKRGRILASELNMSPEELIDELEYLMSEDIDTVSVGVPTSIYLHLSNLHYTVGNLEKAADAWNHYLMQEKDESTRCDVIHYHFEPDELKESGLAPNVQADIRKRWIACGK
jgi:tetratricopeptide (TPR) repeat protein